ncbi:hypothetical protein [Rufibacter latericius]|uniref:Lipoprotein n=1 Tax=Rufibacter latericius TaxID=2487040 RepID=A0A3M9MSW8_9BACT|nr:hypothetical protein [Rufibacter latericius]RNI28579.1 hypothetical protein EFB08_08030 [Rufibacter latericius]
MKSKLFPLFLLALAFGCARPDLISPEEEEAIVQARTKGATILTVNKPTPIGGLLVNLQKIEDSRCPKEATCFWYGVATATLEVQDANGLKTNQRLYLGGPLPAPDNRGFREADTVVVQLGNKPYQLILSDVQPYPDLKNPSPSEKKAMVSVQAL